MRRIVGYVVLALVLLTGCTTRAGAPSSESSWREQADRVLGTAMSSLGTAQVVLESSTDLPHPYAVVTLRDAATGLAKESGSFVTGQPPDSLHAQNEAVVAALGEAATVLTRASTQLASPGLDARTRKPLLEQVKKAYDELDHLRTEVAGS